MSFQNFHTADHSLREAEMQIATLRTQNQRLTAALHAIRMQGRVGIVDEIAACALGENIGDDCSPRALEAINHFLRG